MYGATEAAARLTYLAPADLRRKMGSIGRPIPNVEIAVMSDDGRVARPGEVGELVARGENIGQGYWNDPEETAQRFTPLGYRTGDMGYADAEGYLFLVGRRHDMIKAGAHRVAPAEIEDVLHGHPAVVDCAVFGVADEQAGEVPVAAVQLDPHRSVEPAELVRLVADSLATYKHVRQIAVVDAIHRLPSGKVLRRTLRDEWLSASLTPAGGGS